MSDAQLSSICANSILSNQVITELKRRLAKYEADDVCVVINGSLARREWSAESDCDYFLIVKKERFHKEKLDQLSEEIGKIVSSVIKKGPAEGGAFGTINFYESFLKNIGGSQDNNNMTRRMLLILECFPLCGRDLFVELKKEIIARYVPDYIESYKIPMMLLNDIIRFYRTMCMDFENKTHEKNKPWGIRNIKLIFSRKLIYFTGLLMCGELEGLNTIEKREKLFNLSELTPIERLRDLGGQRGIEALRIYDQFLAHISCAKSRLAFESVAREHRPYPEPFATLKTESHRFDNCLINVLNNRYSDESIIHRAIIV